MTKTGEVINHIEVLEKIAQNFGTQVLAMDDFQSDTAP